LDLGIYYGFWFLIRFQGHFGHFFWKAKEKGEEVGGILGGKNFPGYREFFFRTIWVKKKVFLPKGNKRDFTELRR